MKNLLVACLAGILTVGAWAQGPIGGGSGGGGGTTVVPTTWKGVWSGAASYVLGDGVGFNGVAYVAIAASTNVTPGTDSTKWVTSGPAGPTGATGATGAPGSNGTNGTNGQGVPTGGTAAQILAKVDSTDFNTQWVDPASGNVNGQASSVDGEITLFSGTGGKTIKRATGTGIPRVNSGVYGTPAELSGAVQTAGTNVTTPGKADAFEASLFCSDAGSTDAYACNLSPAITAYTTGVLYWFKANTANTGAATLNLNSLGAKTIKKAAGGITTDLATNDIRAGQWVAVIYDGTNLQMVSTLGNAPSAGGITNSAGNNAVMKSDGTNAVASSLSDDGSKVTSSVRIEAPSFKSTDTENNSSDDYVAGSGGDATCPTPTSGHTYLCYKNSHLEMSVNGGAYAKVAVTTEIAFGQSLTNINGDCTTSGSSTITCTKTNGTNFGSWATSNKTVPTGAVVGDSDAQTLSAKTLTAPVITSSTVAGLPSAASSSGKIYVVTDANSATTCSTGSGSSIVLCRSNGTSWAPLGDGTAAGGSGDFSSNTSSSVDGEIVLFSGTAGKTGKRATGTGMAKIISGVLGTGTAGTDYTTPSSTESPTNKAFDAEGTGNTLTTVEKIWLSAAGCNNATASAFWDLPTSNPAVPACKTGTNSQMGVLDFADGANSLSAQTNIALPSDWTGAIDAKFKWLSSATTGNVVWQIATICVADAETDDPAFNTASTVTDAVKGTTLQTNDATISGVTATGCAAGELMHVKVFRDPAHASDTMAATARLIGVELTLRRAQ